MDFDKLDKEMKEYNCEIASNIIITVYRKLKNHDDISTAEALNLTKYFINALFSKNRKRGDD
ncbi:MAG: hypothetical protein ACLFUH_05825 [Bacteroidales bacterium]